VPHTPPRGHSHREILKSSALIGGSSAINIVIGMVRTKAMALLLDPAGYGVMGAYVQVCDLARSAAQMGLNASGVRQIAEAAASSDAQRIARVVTVLRLTSIVCGLIGAVLLAVLAGLCLAIWKSGPGPVAPVRRQRLPLSASRRRVFPGSRLRSRLDRRGPAPIHGDTGWQGGTFPPTARLRPGAFAVRRPEPDQQSGR
jgi:hypothetical protein